MVLEDRILFCKIGTIFSVYDARSLHQIRQKRMIIQELLVQIGIQIKTIWCERVSYCTTRANSIYSPVPNT